MTKQTAMAAGPIEVVRPSVVEASMTRPAAFLLGLLGLAACASSPKPIASPAAMESGVLATFDAEGVTVFADGESVFVVSRTGAGTSALHRVSRTGGSPELLVAGPFARGLAQCRELLVWASAEGGPAAMTTLEGLPKNARHASGAKSVTIADAELAPEGVTGDGAFVYWTSRVEGGGEGRVVRRIPCAGGAVREISPTGSETPLAAGSGAAVFVDTRARLTTGDRIFVVGARDAPRALVEVKTPVTSVATDGSTVFWVEGGSTIKRMPIDGGDIDVLAPSEGGASSLTVEGSALCWSIPGALRCTTKTPPKTALARVATVFESARSQPFPFALFRASAYALVDRRLLVKPLPPAAAR